MNSNVFISNEDGEPIFIGTAEEISLPEIRTADAQNAFKNVAAAFAIAGNVFSEAVRSARDFEAATIEIAAAELFHANKKAQYGEETYSKLLKAAEDSGYTFAQICTLYDQFEAASAFNLPKPPIVIPTSMYALDNPKFDKPDRIPVPKTYKRRGKR